MCSNQGSEELKIESERPKIQVLELGLRGAVVRLIVPSNRNVSRHRRRLCELISSIFCLILIISNLNNSYIYIQGPPGTAKTMLSEIVSKSAELSFFFYQMHRDTRLSELVGDLVISREDTANGEIIRQNIIKGGILTSEICLLDDISRAPGESLNVLLRILNERKYGDEEIPLLTAIATSLSLIHI